jgi:uncharacterized membrane protein required for colicin V production
MSNFDIILLVILAASAITGLRQGIIRLVGRFFALLVGAFIASRFYLPAYDWASGFWSWLAEHEGIGKIMAFIIVFILAGKLIEFAFYLLEKFFNFIAFIPGSRYLNNILGALLGLLEGGLFLGLIIYVASRYAFLSDFLSSQLAASQVAPYLLHLANIFLPLLPEALKALKSLI